MESLVQAGRLLRKEFERMGTSQQRGPGRFGWAAFSVAAILVAGALTVRGETGTGKPPVAEDTGKVTAGGDDSAAADREAIFVGWPKPDAVLLFTGEQDGYIEPCGCAGLENQKGGLKRRFTMFKQLRDQGWDVSPMDLGGQTRRFGKQAEIKFEFALRGLMGMGYQVVGFGPQDLTMDVLTLAINLPEAKNPLVSANVGLVDFDSGFTKRYKIINAGGLKIGVTTVLGKAEMAGLKNSNDLKLVDPQQALAEVFGELLKEKCDYLVLLSFADPDETKDLARRYKDFDFVVTAGGGQVPPNESRPIEGSKSQLIECGEKAEHAVVIGLYKNGTPKWRYQRVPLDSRFPEAPEMQKLMVDYQHELETLGLDGLGVKPITNMTGRKFAGSKVCGDCHTAAAAVFEKTPHAHATETLENLKPPRHFDPECLSCHVTGWEPQKFFPYASGYESLEKSPGLVGNGCENCHGPAAEHVAAEQGETKVSDKVRDDLRAALRLKIVENEGNKNGPDVNGKPGEKQKDGKVVQMCMECHDLDNSPAFDFQKYWPKVAHHGKD
jgi:Cytochrome c554 and c-prime